MTESIRQLRHVLALCEHRNYRRAAEALCLTQSALVPKLPGWYLDWLAQQYSTNRSGEELHDLFLRAEDLTVIRRIVRETDAVTASMVNTFPTDLSQRDFAMHMSTGLPYLPDKAGHE